MYQHSNWMSGRKMEQNLTKKKGGGKEKI